MTQNIKRQYLIRLTISKFNCRNMQTLDLHSTHSAVMYMRELSNLEPNDFLLLLQSVVFNPHN